MVKCEKCNKEYSNYVEVCPICRGSLVGIDPEAEKYLAKKTESNK